jgi:hypothetical protein
MRTQEWFSSCDKLLGLQGIFNGQRYQRFHLASAFFHAPFLKHGLHFEHWGLVAHAALSWAILKTPKAKRIDWKWVPGRSLDRYLVLSASLKNGRRKLIPPAALVVCAMELCRVLAVLRMEAAMNPSIRRRRWTEEDCDKIRILAGKVSLEEIARLLNRTAVATTAQASKLGIRMDSARDDGNIERAVNGRPGQAIEGTIETVVAPAAIERALSIYRQLKERDPSVLLQARKILTQHIYGMVDLGQRDEQRLIVGGLIQLRAVERTMR